MKKFLVLLGLVLMAFLVAFPIFISASAETTTDVSQPFEWAKLLTLPGAVAATLLIVQYFKMPLDKVFGRVPTRAVVFVIAFGVMILAKIGTEGITAMDWPLLAVNTFLVASSAMGTYELTFAKGESK